MVCVGYGVSSTRVVVFELRGGCVESRGGVVAGYVGLSVMVVV